MSERQFARIMFENDQEFSARQILEGLGYPCQKRRRCHIEIRDKDASKSYRVQVFSRAAEILKQQLLPKTTSVAIIFQDSYDLADAKHTLAKEYGFKSIMFPQTYKPQYIDIRAVNLPIIQFEATVEKLEQALAKIGLKNPAHIGRLCRPYPRKMPKEELE